MVYIVNVVFCDVEGVSSPSITEWGPLSLLKSQTFPSVTILLQSRLPTATMREGKSIDESKTAFAGLFEDNRMMKSYRRAALAYSELVKR